MQINYYPWNTQALSDWIKTEQAVHDGSLDAFANALGISSRIVQGWREYQLVDITLAHLKAITQYRNWSFKQTIEWLDLKAVHLETLLQER